MKTITISNDILEVTISTVGAELTGVKKNGAELLWQKDKSFWARQAPVLFPICGGLRNDTFTFRGRDYKMQKHGFAKNADFSVEYIGREKAVLLLSSSEETKAIYPFDFEFRVVFTLIKSQIKIDYIIKNLTDGDMYFSVGSHEGYAFTGSIENWRVKFEKSEDLYSNNVECGILSEKKTLLGKNVRIFPLKYEYFSTDALVFLDLKSRSLTLENEKNVQKIKVDFDGFPYLLLWTVQDAKFICVEPWCGIPDFVGENLDFSEKKGIIHLQKGEETSRTHTITF